MVRGSDPVKVRAWRERLERFARSGAMAKQFCADEGVSVASFYDWRRKLARTAAIRSHQHEHRDLGPNKHNASTSTFMPVVVSSAPAPVSILLPDGSQISVPSENLNALRTVVGELVRARQAPAEGRTAC